MTYNFVASTDGESSLFFSMSLHLLTVSKSRNVSPTENRVAKQLAIRFRVGGPGELWMCVVSCSTSFFWQLLMSDYFAQSGTISQPEYIDQHLSRKLTFCATTSTLSR